MWRLSLKGAAGHRLRYAMTALAVMMGVAFIAGALVLTGTIGRTFDNLYNQVYASTDVVVRASQPFEAGLSYTGKRAQIDASVARTVRAVPGVAAVSSTIEGYAQLVGRDGKPVGNPAAGPPALGESWGDVASLSPLRILPGGHPPSADNEVAIDKHSATVGRLAVGDRVTVLTKLAPATYTVSGIVTWAGQDSPLGASITVFTPAAAARVLGTPGKVDQVNVQALPGTNRAELVQRVRAALAAPGLEVVTGQAVTREGQDAVHRALGFFNVALLVFALISLFVGSFLIFNTFSMVVAQRQRELALLRALGASRPQVLGTVLGESVLIGTVASAAGLAAGTGLAVGLRAGLAALGTDIPSNGLVLTGTTVVAAIGTGVVVTVASALLPAWRASMVPPLAVMQGAASEARQPPRRRALAGAAMTMAGAASIGMGLAAPVPGPLLWAGAGAAALFVGVAALGPLLARPFARVAGAPLAHAGVPGALARENTVGNPARTSATAAALMVGVALVTSMTIVASSTRASADHAIASTMRADYVVTAGGATVNSGFSPALASSLSRLREVSDVTGAKLGTARVDGATVGVVALSPLPASRLVDLDVSAGSLAALSPTGIAVSARAAAEAKVGIGSRLPVTFTAVGTRALTVEAIYRARAAAGDYVISTSAARALLPGSLDALVYVGLAPGVPPAVGRAAVERVLAAYPNSTLMDQAQFKAEQSRQVGQLLNLVYALLALALLIALMGIANTLSLSVHQRTRELGMLRSVGMTRAQVRSMVNLEALLISLFGAAEGLVLGLALGWALVAALASSGLDLVSVPVAQLLVVTAVATLAGVLASRRPSQRAARLDVLAAVAQE
jgi:putative ABC transport system permease protein